MIRIVAALLALSLGLTALLTCERLENLDFPEHAIALTNARIIDGTGADALENGVIIFSSGNIVAAGPAASTPLPENTLGRHWPSMVKM